TNQYDRSVPKMTDLIYEFADMTPEEAHEKRVALEKQTTERLAAKKAALNASQQKDKEK
ncbi:MAG TPA: 4Fe-4S ferredoxin, partial [Sphingobacteriaceae bacterium]|nr:4Fe-4S ferredoxin [Sphingobacteriaceae bacterium]